MSNQQWLLTTNDGTDYTIQCSLDEIEKLIVIIGPENILYDVEET